MKHLQDDLNAIIEKYGPYTVHNLKLADGIYTINDKVSFDHFKLNRIKQILSDLGFLQSSRRLLDIASLESMFAIEFALEGLDVTSIEGRKASLEKAKFAAKALGLENIKFRVDDVNNITPEKYGEFDIILCMGILYHITKGKYLRFLKNVTECCKDILIIDTFISLHGRDFLEEDGIRYRGTIWREFEDSADDEEKASNLHASLTDNLSFSMSKDSLIKYLEFLGFTSVYEAHLPSQPNNPIDRITLVCKKASRVSLKVFPKFNHKKHYDDFQDTRGIGNSTFIHWNENRMKKSLRRVYQITRNKLKSFIKLIS